MIEGYRVKLLPNNRQQTLLSKSAGTARWAYNWCLSRQKENYENGGKFIQDGELRKEITQLKKTDEYAWLNDVSAQIPKQAIKDACDAFKRFFKKQSNFPRFKRKRDNQEKFYQRYDRLKIFDGKANLEKIGWVRLAEPDRIPENVVYSNPRVKFDGINWWLTVGVTVEVDDNQVKAQKTEPIGIDLGLKTLAVCSNGMTFTKPDIKNQVKKLKRLQKRASRYYEETKKQKQGGENRCKSARLIKLETEIRKVHQRITNVLQNNIHQMTAQLVKLNPEAIVLEDLNVSGMLKNRHLSNSVRQAKFREIRRQLEYKCGWNNIEFVLADRFYPSSKTCSSCGLIKQDLRLSDRVFKCECGLEIDRDFNASLNLKRLFG